MRLFMGQIVVVPILVRNHTVGSGNGLNARQGKKKEPAASYSRTSERRTTLGDGALDFRVRNGNGYGSSSMATGEKPGSGRTERGLQLATRPVEKALGRSRRA